MEPLDRVVPRPASTVALLRHGPDGAIEVLLTHRPATMAFGPGLHVFPGGAVDPDDADGPLADRSVLTAAACAADWVGDLEPGPALGHAIAVIRELHEECGVLLATTPDGSPARSGSSQPLADLAARLDLAIRTDWLTPHARWVTPPLPGSRRFDTRFYVAWLPAGAEVTPHAGEVVAHEWMAPTVALERYVAGAIDLWPPTSSTLAQLERVASPPDVRALLKPWGPVSEPVISPRMDGLIELSLGCAGGVPGRSGQAWIVGRQRVVVVNLGDPTEASLDAILGTVNRHGMTIAAVAVTSARPEAMAGAVGLALVADVPLYAAPGAAARIGEPAMDLAEAGRITAGDVELVLELREEAWSFAMPELGISVPAIAGA